MYARPDNNISEVGARVCGIDHTAIPMEILNPNPFQQGFGIHFKENDKYYIRSISNFEYSSCFNLERTLKLRYSSNSNLSKALYKGCPGNTMKAILEACYERLISIRESTLQIDEDIDEQTHSRVITAPAATAFNVLQGIITLKLPTKTQWIKAYASDSSCTAIINMIKNPGLINKHNLATVHYRFRQPLRDQAIIIENDFLILKERIDENSFVKLRIVPEALWNIIFLAFHANPIGGHFSVYYTFHRIRLRFFWPKMYNYIKTLCRMCAACGLANSTQKRSKELVYSFPVDAPFKLVICDIYKAGDIAAFDGEKALFVLLDHMTGYAVIEGLDGMNSTIFSKVFMKIILQHGFCHTVIVDADPKFKAVFQETMRMLQVNFHMASGNNHDSILVERFNLFLNKGLKILCTERSTTRSFIEAAQLLTYAWNSAPMAETDISRSLVAVGREYLFPIDVVDQPSPNPNLSAQQKLSYTEELRARLKGCREVYKILIDEHRRMHREYINARRPDPTIFQPGDIVWCRRQIQSNKKRQIVGKLRFKQTGPWKIMEKLKGGSYKLQLLNNEKRSDKKHASELSMFPQKLVPLPQLAGTDNTYSQIHKKLSDDPFSEAGIKGYNGYDLSQPWQIKDTQIAAFARHIPQAYLQVEPFPTLQELNDTLLKQSFAPGNSERLVPPSENLCTHNQQQFLTSENNLAEPGPPAPSKVVKFGIDENLKLPATISELMTKIINSDDKLFFIKHRIPTIKRVEWRLVQIDFEQSVNKNPLALTNGQVLATFYVSHPKDAVFNAPNQRFWKQYHKEQYENSISLQYHLISPTKDENNYCKENYLKAYKEWININDPSIFIFGPFNFAIIRGRKTVDRISVQHWEQLHSVRSTFDNEVPAITNQLCGYVCHVDTPFHSKFHSESITASVHATLFNNHFT